jgi:hypothetical protein
MTKDDKAQGRVSEQRYRDLPEGHRTTLVVGMSDMLERMSQYLDAQSNKAFEPLLEWAGQYESGRLRELFDSYLTEVSVDKEIGVASSFLAMLIKESGALR